MKSPEETDRQVARIEKRISFVQWRIQKTDDRIEKLFRLNERRKKTLHELGRKRAEVLTFELF